MKIVTGISKQKNKEIADKVITTTPSVIVSYLILI